VSKVLITTISSPDEFSAYIPMFVYSVKRAYPTYYVKVFVTGELKSEIKTLLDTMKTEQWVNPGWEVLENQFQDIPKTRKYLHNALRLFIDDSHYAGYDFGYVTDVDFLMFRHKPTLKQHYVVLMARCKEPYVAARGPYRKPRRKKINKGGWIRKYKRVIIGRLFFEIPTFLDKTRAQRQAYLRRAIDDKHDSWDTHKPGSYREYDEVTFNRILKESGMRTPRKPTKTLAGCGIGNLYRDIHLGDFKFSKRAHSKRLVGRIKEETISEYIKMRSEPHWNKILEVCKERSAIREAMRRLNKHVHDRTGR